MNPVFSGLAISVGICLSLFGANALAQTMSVADRIAAAEDKADAYRAENQQLKQTVATQSAALRRLDQQLQDLRAQVLQQQQDSASLQGSLQESRQQLAQSQTQLASCRSQSESLSAELERARSQVVGYAQDAQNRQQYVEDQRTALLQATEKLRAAEARVAACTTETEDMSTELTAQSTALNTCMVNQRDLAEQLRQQEQRSGAEQAQFDQLQARIAECRSRNESLSTELVSASQALDGKDQALNSCLADSRAQQQQQQDLGQLQARLSEAQDRNRALQALTQEQQTRMDELQQHAGATEQQAARLQAQLDHVLARNEALQTAMSACESRPAPQAPSCPPAAASDNEEIAALREALTRANAEIRETNERLNRELQVERTLHARSEAQLEQECQERIRQLQSSGR